MVERKTIFIVEDESMIGLMLEDFLDSLGYGLGGMAETLELACEKARQGGFDAAILDCNLAGEKVWPVADILLDTGIPFVFATGGSSDEIPPRFANCLSLEKPFTMATVESLLERLFLTA